MIVLDTRILVYARRAESAHHAAAKAMLRGLAGGAEPWAPAWPCIYEFLRVVTHPRVFDPPTDLENALEDLVSLIESPSLTMMGEGPAHFGHLRRMVQAGQASGNLVYDAHIAALAVEHGARELWTTDRDFSRFPGLKTADPFSPREIRESRTRRPTSASRRERRA